MKSFFLTLGVAGALMAAPMIKRDLLITLEKDLYGKLVKDMQIFVHPSGVYVDGYGVVFSSEINLSYAAMVSPFQQVIPPEERVATHERELKQVSVLRARMTQFLISSAMTLDPLPMTEQIAVGVKITHQGWEDRSGMPEQIVMQGQKAKLIEAKLGHVTPESVIRTQEQP